jgi:hypothetical protein
MNIFKRLLLAIVLFVPVLLAPSIAFGQNNEDPSANVKYEKVNMKDGSRYLIKRLEEKTILFFLSFNSEKKINYYEKLLNVRLAELKYIVDNKDIANIQVASQRYFTTAGELTNFLVSKGASSSKKEEVKNLFSEHIKIIEIFKGTYDNTTAEWRLLRDDANYLIDYSTFLK